MVIGRVGVAVEVVEQEQGCRMVQLTIASGDGTMSIQFSIDGMSAKRLAATLHGAGEGCERATAPVGAAARIGNA